MEEGFILDVLQRYTTYKTYIRLIKSIEEDPLDKFELGIKTIIESLMMQRMFENDTIVSRYMDDKEFQKTVLPLLAQEIYKILTC